jgi:hypothetical protein
MTQVCKWIVTAIPMIEERNEDGRMVKEEVIQGAQVQQALYWPFSLRLDLSDNTALLEEQHCGRPKEVRR